MPSITNKHKFALFTLSNACFNICFEIVSLLFLTSMPAASMNLALMSKKLASTSFLSLVVPTTLATIEDCFFPTILLNKVVFPTFARPTIAMVNINKTLNLS